MSALFFASTLATVAAYDINAAVSWSGSCCGSGGCSECPCVNSELNETTPEWVSPRTCACECSEFVSRALKHGGYDDGIIKYVPTLWDYLSKSTAWKNAGTSGSVVQAGDVVIYGTVYPDAQCVVCAPACTAPDLTSRCAPPVLLWNAQPR
jgi:hypothetical protein